MSDDLLKNLILNMNAEVYDILVNELKENTFYAVISVVCGDITLSIDSRPSDAIALALRTKSPIFVEEKVIEAAKSLDLPDPEQTNTDDEKQWQDWLNKKKPEDIPKL